MKPTIAMFINDPKCSVQSGNGLLRALEDHYHFKLFSKNEMEDGFFDKNIDMVAVPGGFGDSDSFDTLLKQNGKYVRKFVKRGGKYLGICMGAFWAGHHYFNILDNVDVVQYIKQPGTCTRRPHAKNMPTNWYNGHHQDMFFYDGPTFIGDGEYETHATYANTGMPMAIVQNNIGLIGCHPESEQFWYDSYSWMKGKYHGGLQHELLLDFVNDLMER
jgi:glutamine amidotransferase-like uncharacterized protein